jgi:hypothetical protein
MAEKKKQALIDKKKSVVITQRTKKLLSNSSMYQNNQIYFLYDKRSLNLFEEGDKFRIFLFKMSHNPFYFTAMTLMIATYSLLLTIYDFG